jgi:hypothetical protein
MLQNYVCFAVDKCLSWVDQSGVRCAAIRLRNSGNTFSGVMNHGSPSGSPTDKSGFGRCHENATCPNA